MVQEERGCPATRLPAFHRAFIVDDYLYNSHTDKLIRRISRCSSHPLAKVGREGWSNRVDEQEELMAAHSDAFVFFGATGDLAYKKIFPALQEMVRHNTLSVPIIGVAKSGWTVE